MTNKSWTVYSTYWKVCLFHYVMIIAVQDQSPTSFMNTYILHVKSFLLSLFKCKHVKVNYHFSINKSQTQGIIL